MHHQGSSLLFPVLGSQHRNYIYNKFKKKRRRKKEEEEERVEKRRKKRSDRSSHVPSQLLQGQKLELKCLLAERLDAEGAGRYFCDQLYAVSSVSD